MVRTHVRGLARKLVPPPLHGVSDHMTESGRFGLARTESVPKKEKRKEKNKNQPSFPKVQFYSNF